MSRSWLFNAILLSSLVTSCKHRPAEELTEVQQAQEELNSGDYSRAIVRLERYSSENPGDHQAISLLSSAYAGSVGINLIDSYNFFESFIDDDKKTIKSRTGGSGDSFEATAKKIQVFLLEISDQGSIFFKIPFTKVDNRKALDIAIAKIATIPQDSPELERIKLYSAFLHVLQFSNYLKDMFPTLDFQQNQSGVDLLCALDSQNFSQRFSAALDHFSLFADDLEWLNAHRQTKIGKQATKLVELARYLKKKIDPKNLTQGQDVVREIQADYCT